MSKVIVHPGPAHRDEFLAACLLLTAGKVDVVWRRDYTPDDLTHKECYVVDQGKVHDPELNNFDHHQFPRESEPTCSVTLILPAIGVNVDLARQIWTWLPFTELLDSKGPFATAKSLGMDPDAFFSTLSPIEISMLRWFEQQDCIQPDASGWHWMKMIGEEKLNYYRDVRERLGFLGRRAQFYEVAGFHVCDVRMISKDANPVLGLEIFLKSIQHDVPVTITRDQRSNGISLFRRNDDPRLDFSKIEGEEGVSFAHKGGFLAIIDASMSPLPFIEKALVKS